MRFIPLTLFDAFDQISAVYEVLADGLMYGSKCKASVILHSFFLF